MDPIERIEKATEQAAAAVKGVKPEHMSNSTPCSDFDVNALLNHMIVGMHMLTTAAETGKAEMLDGNRVDDDPGAQYAEARVKLLDAVRAPGALEKTWEMPFGGMPGSMMAGIAFMEHLTHAWDIRKATGQDAELPADLVAECTELVTPMDAMLRMPGVCGPAVPAPDGATQTQKLMAFLGRES